MVSKVGEGLDSNIMGVTSGVGIVDREATIDLADGVGLGLTLSIAVDSMAIANSMMSITVADGAIAIDTAIAIVHSSDDAIAIAMSDLADGVGLSL